MTKPRYILNGPNGGERIAIGDEEVVELYGAVAETWLVDFIDFELDNDLDHLRRVREHTLAVGESASAPGQIPIGDLVTVFDIIRRARGGEMF